MMSKDTLILFFQRSELQFLLTAVSGTVTIVETQDQRTTKSSGKRNAIVISSMIRRLHCVLKVVGGRSYEFGNVN